MSTYLEVVKKVIRRTKRMRVNVLKFRRRAEEDVDADEMEVPAPLNPLLRDYQEKKLRVLSEILGKSERSAAAELYNRMFTGLPDRALHSFLLPDLKLKSCERVSDTLVRLELQNGRVFFGERSNEKEYLLYNVFRFYLPELVDGDSYKLALDVQRRYLGPKLRWYNSMGGVLVEGGCFTGMKAIRWHDDSPAGTRVLAVEIGKTNSEILSANIRANGLEDSITSIHAGLWRESGEGSQKHSYSTRRFLESTDRWKGHMVHEEKVRLLCIRDLLDENKIDVASYFNVQVNGAEIEVLNGALDVLDRVKIFDIAAYYGKDGKRNIDVVREILSQNGCTILNESKQGRIAAVTPKFRDEILAHHPKRGRKRKKRSAP